MSLNFLDNLEWIKKQKIFIDVGNSVALEFIESNMKSILIYVTQTSATGTKGDKSVSWEKPWPTTKSQHTEPMEPPAAAKNGQKRSQWDKIGRTRRWWWWWEMRRSRDSDRSRVRVMRTMDRDGFDCCVTSPSSSDVETVSHRWFNNKARTHAYIHKDSAGIHTRTHTHARFQAK